MFGEDEDDSNNNDGAVEEQLPNKEHPTATTTTFQDFYTSEHSNQEKTSFRFRDSAPKKNKKKEVSPFDCCRVCPEMFEGLDVIPNAVETNNALELSESTSVNKGRRRSLDSFLEIESAPSSDSSDLPSIPLTLEQVISRVPCCPVCLEQFDPPVDVDDSAFIELGESTKSFLQEKFVVGSSAKAGAGVKYRCCTLCPNDQVAGMGSYQGASFLELEVGKGGKAGKGGPAPPKGIDMTTGCCDTCPTTMFESTETRFAEPMGGPFGLKPRIKEVSEAFPMQTPTFSGGSLTGTTNKQVENFFGGSS